MMPNLILPQTSFRRILMILCLAAALVTSGCAFRKAPPPKQVSHQQPKTAVDVKAQQHYYDLGLQQYSQEHFREARESFQRVVDLGPATELGQKAQENLRKIQQILKTLEDIESK